MRFLLLLFFIPLTLSASELDSLNILISRTKPPLQNKHLYERHRAIGMGMIKRGAYDSAEVELREALEYATQSRNKAAEGKAHYNLGYLYDKKKELINSIDEYRQAVNTFREIGDSSLLAQSLSSLGIAYKYQGIKEEAIRVLLESFSYVDPSDTNDQETMASNRTTLGNIYREMLEYSKALANHQEALAIRVKLHDKGRIASCFNNLGNVYKEMCRSAHFTDKSGCMNDSALYYYKMALFIRVKESPNEHLANVYSNLGEVYFDKGNISSAHAFFSKAHAIRVSKNIKDGVAYSLIDFAHIDVYNKDYKQAENRLKDALRIAKELHFAEIEKNIYRELYNVSVKKGDLDQALLYSQYYHLANDSLNNIKKQREIINAEFEYEIKVMRQQRSLDLLQQKQAVIKDHFQNRVQWFLVSGICLLLVLLMVSYYAFLLKKRSSIQHQTHMRELHHRVKNNLQMLSSVLSLQSNQVTDPLIKEAVRSSENRVRAMTLLHRKLYNEHNVMIINMPAYIGDLVHSLEDIYHDIKANLILKVEIEEMDVDKAIPLGLIVNELVSNAFKYAFPDHANPRLKVLFYMNTEGKQVLVVEDNGYAVNHETEKGAGSYGLKLVNTLSEQLKASLSIRKDEGFRYELIIP